MSKVWWKTCHSSASKNYLAQDIVFENLMGHNICSLSLNKKITTNQ